MSNKLVEVMGIEPMSQRAYHPVYFYSLIWYRVEEKSNKNSTSGDRQDTEMSVPISHKYPRREFSTTYRPLMHLCEVVTNKCSVVPEESDMPWRD